MLIYNCVNKINKRNESEQWIPPQKSLADQNYPSRLAPKTVATLGLAARLIR